MMEGKESNRIHQYSNSAFHMIYKSIIKKEISLANYVIAQSQKLRALFGDKINTPSDSYEFKYIPIYRDIYLLFRFINDQEIIRTKEIYTYSNISKKFNIGVNNERSNLKEDYSEGLIKALNAQKHLMDSILLVFERMIKPIKLNNYNIQDHLPSIHELLILINQIYELQELRTKKVEALYMADLTNKISSDKFQPLFDSIELSIKLIKIILSTYHFESITFENRLRQNIISLIKLKNRFKLMMDEVIITTTKTEMIKGENSRPWLSNNIKVRRKKRR